ncbi:efflux RND transporter periplasmic adaptor subunit, partial [Jannaschia donghaensis]|uniref:efflux RND transporter periplasmic adaptor subunit n=1 Tax=Jannaschia donghaensis TaxID=420998 RepID=UPI001187722F
MISQIRYAAIAAAAILALTGCKEEGTNATTGDGPRSVRTVVAEPAAPVRTRAFPAVLEPPEITPLAFDVGGRLGALDLRIGETVAAGTVLATVEAGDAELRTSQARSSVVEAQAAATNAREEADRQEQLLARAVVSQAARDSAVTQAEQAEARLEQARRNLELVEESLDDTALVAPFDAVVNSIEVQAFGSVQAGQPVVTLYEEGGLQAQIAVSYAVVSGLTLGQEVVVVPTDGDARPLAARISEI